MAKTSLFVGDLSIFCKEADLHDMFAPFGEILEIKIMRNEHTSQNLSYGFLKYSKPLSAKRAMTELNQVVLCGRPMRWVLLMINGWMLVVKYLSVCLSVCLFEMIRS